MRPTRILALAAGVVLATATVATGAALAADPATTDPSILTRAVVWIAEQQRHFHRALTGGLDSLSNGGGLAAAWGLIGASFLYGVFHAAGPGHGKAILTTYLLTHRERLARGVGLAAAAAACQGITAVVLVYGLITLAGLVPREATAAALWSERASYGLVMAVGALLMWRALRRLWARSRSAPPSHHHDHDHDHGPACGHDHGPSADQIGATAGWRASVGLVLSIGLRPCSGAIVVLVFAAALGLAWAGIAAVAAMSLGTMLAVAGLALLAVGARQWAARLAARGGNSGGAVLQRAGDLVALAGGAVVVVLGLGLVMASFAPAHPLGL
ncbi:MAG: hypothetical protein KDE22_07575 [Rhodobacterales bacterium]|nr:hypothetical protein [Rhodobacterales bacterium]